MSTSYDSMMGSPTDPEDHSSYNIPQATEHYAGDVLPIPGEKSMGSGGTLKAPPYYYGTKSDPKVISILPKIK